MKWRAADLLAAMWDVANGRAEVVWRLDDMAGRDAVLTRDGVLCCPGSNELVDWYWNIFAAPFPYAGVHYHGGFLEEALAILSAISAAKRPMRAAIGFSRGAAVAAIISRLTGVPALALACPRYHWRFEPARRARVVHFNLVGDPVAYVPLLAYRRFRGRTVWALGAGHSLQLYLRKATRHLERIERCFETLQQPQ